MSGRPPPTSEQLRAAIDSGRAGGKSDALDPAASPLGTDDEAGGAPSDARQRTEAYAQEVRDPEHRAPARPNDAMPLTHSHEEAPVWLVIVALLVAIGVSAVLLAQPG